ncbi:MAG: polysaccharide biosynthesis/export family protein [Elusimicrobia bacterium]|nr:polysaccharide biosynthesis/export family protein [Elusimicrobiota bacterium]
MSRKKKSFMTIVSFAFGMITLLFIFTRIADLLATSDTYSVKCTDKRAGDKSISLKAQNIKGKYYLSLRDVCLFYRVEFSYNPVKKTAVLRKDIRTVTVKAKSRKFIIGDKKVKIKDRVIVSDNKLMFPAYALGPFLTELLVNYADWDESTKSLVVSGSGTGTDFWGNEINVGSEEKKIINAGDTLSISVWQKGSFELPELQRDRDVEQDGAIKFPFIGRTMAAGLSPEQLEAKLAKQLEPYVRTPDVTVTISNKTTYKVQIYGEVRNPGLYSFTDKATLMEAINRAGGFGDDAKLASVRVTRFVHHSPYVTETVNCKKILYDGERQYDLPVFDNDIVFVPKRKSLLTNLISFMGRILDFVIMRRIDGSSLVNG